LVSKSQIKLITSLQKKKFRDKEGLFIAEGPKVISELMNAGLKLHLLFSTVKSESTPENAILITETELQKISVLKTANTSLAIFEIPSQNRKVSEGLILAMDAIRDPGNLGTIIRLCDWFGVTQLVCSMDTADCFNPKVVQATMGSIARVHVQYTNLSAYLKDASLPVYGGVLDGKNIYTSELPKNAIIVLGNEANGISGEIMKRLTHKITIPQFGASHQTESLNVATATAILLSEFNRTTGT
jgi:TrmH family RNA methyltransferase